MAKVQVSNLSLRASLIPGRVHPWVGLGWVEFLKFWMGWFGLGYGVQVPGRNTEYDMHLPRRTAVKVLATACILFYSDVFHLEYFWRTYWSTVIVGLVGFILVITWVEFGWVHDSLGWVAPPLPFGRICFVVLVMRKGRESSWSGPWLYIGSFPCAQLPGPVHTARLGQVCFCVFSLGLCFVCSFVFFDLFVCPHSFMFPEQLNHLPYSFWR